MGLIIMLAVNILIRQRNFCCSHLGTLNFLDFLFKPKKFANKTGPILSVAMQQMIAPLACGRGEIKGMSHGYYDRMFLSFVVEDAQTQLLASDRLL